MLRKIFTVPLDLKDTTASRPFKVKEGDSGNVIIIPLTDGGLAVNLTDCKVLAEFSLESGETAEQDTDGNGVTISGNVITIDLWTTSMYPGIVGCELQIYSGVDFSTLVTTATFTFSCLRTITNSDTVQRVPQYPILTALIQRVQQVINGVQSDWAQTNSSLIDYIKNKPSTFTPAAHAASHQTGGADPVTPILHATRHAEGGADALSPTDIGAATASAITVSLTVNGWTGEGPYTQTVAAAGVSSDANACHIVTSAAFASRDEYGQCEVAPSAQGAETITFQCTEKPENALSVNILIIK